MDTLIEWVVRFLAWVFRRPRLNVRVIEDDPDSEPGGLRFEAENTSPSPSSLDPVVQARFMYPSAGRMRRGAAVFDVRELDRELPPFSPKLFSASARALPPGYGHAWFRVYRFRARGGVPRRVRIRNALLEPLGPARFWFELWRFRLCGRVKKGGPMTLSDWQALKRSQGPH
jgi:hypothetical protein